jgi:hypothetical protein
LSENSGLPPSIIISPIFYIHSPITWGWYGTTEILAATIPRVSVAHHHNIYEASNVYNVTFRHICATTVAVEKQ